MATGGGGAPPPASPASVAELACYLKTSPRVYPTLAPGVPVVSGAADWVLGEFAEIVPSNTITQMFHVSSVVIESLDRNAVFELVLYQSLNDIEIARGRFSVQGGLKGGEFSNFDTGSLMAGVRIRARLASSDGAARVATATISIGYHFEGN